MKLRLFRLFLLLALTTHFARAAETSTATNYVIGLSPFLENSVKDDLFRRIIGFLLEDVPLGSSLSLYDAYRLQTIARANVPNVRAFQSGKTRANQFKNQIAKLKEFLATTHQKPDSAAHLNLDQAVRFPEFMDFVGDNLMTSNGSLVVVIIGSPLYMDPKEPGFSMVEGYFPSDAHLLAGRERSIFGTKDRQGKLKDVAVHYAYFGDPWVSEVHQERIARFWTLYLREQGAQLATFCGDLPTVFSAVRAGTSTIRPCELDRTQKKIEMLRITRDIGVADWITRDLSPNTINPPPSRTVGRMKIGIRWKGDIDLDVYATPSPGAETLFFEHTRSPEGYYFKDHRTSPDREYEFIEFETPVDVWKADARINFFEGHFPGGPSGEIRIEFDSRIYTGEFHLAAEHGNEGRTGSRQRNFWARIDIPAILKLRPNAAAATPRD